MTFAIKTFRNRDSEQKEAPAMHDMLGSNKMVEATRLTRAGRLIEATALLQRMLRAEPRPDMTIGTADDTAHAGGEALIIDAAAKSEETDRPPSSVGNSRTACPPFAGAATTAQPNIFRRLGALLRAGRPGAGLGLPGLVQPAPARTSDIVPAGGKFIEAKYSNPAGTRAYKLYIPSGYRGQACPLVVMLHGCTQSPDDFAAGTRMNLIAEEQTCLVVYPAQVSEANAAKCWNWFRASDQRRGQGEPSLIAGITRQVMRLYSVDPRRVYIAGLSAGAAAAAVMGATYPDLYAAIGVHSGLAWGAASDLPSAFSAMRQGDSRHVDLRQGDLQHDDLRHGDLPASSRSGDISTVLERWSAVPTIVFHGDRDNIVHPRNGDHVIAQKRTTSLQKKVHRARVPGGHAYTRTIHTDASGRAILEHWVIHGAGHAWSGGSPAGSYTDPQGPDAAREMLRFFLDHSNSTAAA
jgi:poly(hydroxyalkanoate) depolymerase family esterase